MNIVIASGKGGTGKTTLAVNLAYALSSVSKRVALLDCDVEEPNCHLFVRPTFSHRISVEVKRPVWDETKCTGCGACGKACKFNAIAMINKKALFFEEMCKSCGLCAHVCPEKAIQEAPAAVGTVESDFESNPFLFSKGTINIGEASANPVIKSVLQNINQKNINIIDASPGTGCSVVEVFLQADIAVLVTEPTPFGLYDLKLAVSLALQMRIPVAIVINKSGCSDHLITDFADTLGIPVIGRIPFKREFAEAYAKGTPLIKAFPQLKINVLRIYERIEEVSRQEPSTPVFLENLPERKITLHAFQPGSASSQREIMIISGKGGTGKTSIAAALMTLSQNQVIVDCDVDAPDLHLLLQPSIIESHDFTGSAKASIDFTRCTGCEDCLNVCRFDAINVINPSNTPTSRTCQVNKHFCEGCGFCELVCPADAITMAPGIVGKTHLSSTSHGYMSHALLGMGQENSGKLVTGVKEQARKLTRQFKVDELIGDGPPGIGCPVIASMGGTDLVLIVTEPTISGVHDMQRVLTLTQHFHIPAAVIINKADLNREQRHIIYDTAERAGARVLAEIPFDEKVNEALMQGKTITEYGEGPPAAAAHNLWKILRKELSEKQSMDESTVVQQMEE